MITYDTHVKPFSNTFNKIVIPEEKTIQIKEFVIQLVEKKLQESHHKIDGKNEYKRYYTGLLGEAALEILLGTDIIDWSIGSSNDYHTPDIKDLKIGIKSVEYGKFPIIFKSNYYPQIINIRTSKDIVFICGLATQVTLNKYQSDDLILSPLLRSRGTKTGFYGFNELIPFNNYDDLKKISNNL